MKKAILVIILLFLSISVYAANKFYTIIIYKLINGTTVEDKVYKHIPRNSFFVYSPYNLKVTIDNKERCYCGRPFDVIEE